MSNLVKVLKSLREKMKKNLTAIVLALSALATTSVGQTLSLEDLAAKVEERTKTLGGYEDFLMDPDPKRSMAALQIMLESGEESLVQMALNHGLTSPDSAVRQTALKAYFQGKPSLGISVTAESLPDDEKSAGLMDIIFRKLNGSWGNNKEGSISIKVGDYNEELGCNVRGTSNDVCATRTNAMSVSVYLASSVEDVPSQWVEMKLNDTGSLVGGFIASNSYYNSKFKSPPLKATIQLVE